MRAGNLDRRIRFDRSTKPWPLDAAGQPAPAFVEAYRCWAERKPTGGNEAFSGSGEQRVAKATLDFRIRWPPAGVSITPDESWRLVDLSDNGRVYDLVAVVEIGRREGLLVTAIARAE